MSSNTASRLGDVLEQIDRPGSFCATGSAPAVLPGLEVKGVGPVSFPLTAKQAKELKKHCEQAPYGKGEQTLVDTKVRRVWHMTPEQFSLTNPDWDAFLQQTLGKVQEDLGLEKQKLEAHLYDLLLYEPGSFFLPHRDGEKLDRMVATLVIVLPSSFQGGELVVRHEGQEQVVDFSGDNSFRIHYAAFYADCEHEISPLREGHRLCLVYNLTLKKARSKKGLTAPRSAEYIEQVADVLREWVKDQSEDAPRKLAVTLEHQYTQDGLAWDALKGVDRAWARVLQEGARQADCQALLALLTFHEMGSAEYAGGGGYGYDYYDRWEEDYDDEDYDDDDDDEEDEDEDSEYEMVEVIDSELTAEHFSDSQGNRLNIGKMDVEEDELVFPDALQDVKPEEEFEGYTGNAGMTLDRWYRHGAILLWPNDRHFDILCDVGNQAAVAGLTALVRQWQKAGKKEAPELRGKCLEFASTIIERWDANPYRDYDFDDFDDLDEDEKKATPKADPLLESLALLDEPGLIRAYLGKVVAQDPAVDPGKALARVLDRHGWRTFQPELETILGTATGSSVERNARLLENVCLAKPRKKEGWQSLCEALARTSVAALESLDEHPAKDDWHLREVDRSAVLVSLARALLATGQDGLLARLIDHSLAHPRVYPLTEAHVAALGKLAPWLKKNVTKRSAALARWLAACREQLEALTAEMPQPPADFRRPAEVSCNCADCRELKRFLADAKEEVHRFTVAEARRQHLESSIRHDRLDVDTRTERRGRPYTLIGTKNTKSYQARLKKYHEDLKHLAALRQIEASLPR
jgi:hypothetical protein